MTDQKLLMSIKNTVNALDVSRSKIYELIEKGELETAHIGRRRLVTVASAKRLVERRLAAAS
ncbi:MAG: helix-turn-helix domain-containing protein [Rhizobiaceae bacterium]